MSDLEKIRIAETSDAIRSGIDVLFDHIQPSAISHEQFTRHEIDHAVAVTSNDEVLKIDRKVVHLDGFDDYFSYRIALQSLEIECCIRNMLVEDCTLEINSEWPPFTELLFTRFPHRIIGKDYNYKKPSADSKELRRWLGRINNCVLLEGDAAYDAEQLVEAGKKSTLKEDIHFSERLGLFLYGLIIR